MRQFVSTVYRLETKKCIDRHDLYNLHTFYIFYDWRVHIYLHISGRARGLEVFAKPPAFEDEFIHANFSRKNNAKDF